ncbi:MAG: hypothetical protein HY438_00695 [DPANN group archaeon]|nr:hypothetical protein [DPANN group archaeon]
MEGHQDLQAIIDSWNPRKNEATLTDIQLRILAIVYERNKQIKAGGMPLDMVRYKTGMRTEEAKPIIRQLCNKQLAVIAGSSLYLKSSGYELFMPEREIMPQIVSKLYELCKTSGYKKIILTWIAREAGFGDFSITRYYLGKLEQQGVVAQEKFEQSGKPQTNVWLTVLGERLAQYLQGRQSGTA